ncbi:DUF3710 domain-containing protein [Micromonospora sp. C95]|nr:DUF3710 domain-containing protein [Micromonospora sp. C95]
MPRTPRASVDIGRVAEVIVKVQGTGPGRRGSGYRASPGHVITAAHVVKNAASLQVRFSADRPDEWVADAAVAWMNPEVDLAVLALVPEPDTGPVAPLAFGLVADEDHTLTCSAVGFPRSKLRDDRVRRLPDGRAQQYRDSFHMIGEISALSHRREGTLAIITSEPERDPDPAVSPWEGMSGAAVFSNGRLLGLVCEHHRSDGLGTLSATRVDRLYEVLDPAALGQLHALIGLPLDVTGLHEMAPADPDESAEATGGSPRKQVWNMPPRNPRFTGREESLAELRRRLTTANAVVLHALYGMGGIGKTQIAIEYAHRFRDDYDVVWWVPAEHAAVTKAQLALLASKLGITHRSGPSDLAAALTARGRWLLIFDNAQSANNLRDQLALEGGHVIVTSRNPSFGAVGERLEIHVMRREESVALLSQRIASMTREQAEQLAEELGDLPLALEQAAAYIEIVGLPVEDYRRMLRERPGDMLAEGEVLGTDARVSTVWDLSLERLRDEDPPALAILEMISLLAPEPFPLHLVSDYAEEFDEPLRAVADDEVALNRAIGAIRRYSLAQRTGGAIQLHRLLQSHIKASMTEEVRGVRLRQAMDMVLQAFMDMFETDELWRQGEELLPHALVLEADDRSDSATSESAASLHALCALYLSGLGNVQAAFDEAQRAFSLAEQALGPDSQEVLSLYLPLVAELAIGHGRPELARSLLERGLSMAASEGSQLARMRMMAALAMSLLPLGRLPEALELTEQLMTSLSAAPIPDDERDAITLSVSIAASQVYARAGQRAKALDAADRAMHLTEMLVGPMMPSAVNLRIAREKLASEIGRTTDAQQVLQTTLDSVKAHFGENHRITFQSTHVMATALHEMGKYAEAADVHKEILQQRRAVLGENHPDTLRSAHELADNLRHLGEYAQALEVGEDALRTRRASLGESHPDTLRSAHELALTLHAMGNYDQAHDLKRKVLQQRHATLGENHPDTLTTGHSLAITLYAMGDHRHAHDLERKVLQQQEATLGENHPDTLATGHSLATTLHAMGEYTQAADRYRDVAQRRQTTLGEYHPDTLATRYALAITLYAMGKYDQAHDLERTVLRRREATLGDNHPDTLRSAHELALTLHAMGNYDQAHDLKRKVLQQREATLGENHPDTLTTGNSLATTLHAMSEYTQAADRYRDVAQRRQTTLGENHPDTLATEHALAVTLHAMGNYDQAHDLERKVLQQREATLGDNHPDTLRSAHELAVTLHAMGNYHQAHDLKKRILQQQEATLGDNHPDTLRSAHELAVTLHAMGNYHQAHDLKRKVLRQREATLGGNHPDTLATEHALATTLHAMSEYTQAADRYRDVAQRRQTTLGDNHPDTLATEHALAITLHAMGDHRQAHDLKRKVLQQRETTLGENHPDTLTTEHSLATTLHAMSEYTQAADRYRDVLQRRQTTLGDNHPDTLTTEHALAVTLHEMGNYDQAHDLERKVLQQREATLGENHPDTLATGYSLALTLYAMGRYDQAHDLERKVLRQRETTLGENHPDTLRSAHELAVTLHAMGNYDQAHDLERKVLRQREATLGENHPDTLRSAHELAVTLHAMGNYDQAHDLKRKVLQQRHATLGENHPDTLTTEHALATTLHAMSEYTQAADRYRDVAQRRQTTLGDNHPDTLTTEHALAVTLHEMGNYDQAHDLKKRILQQLEATLGENHPDTLTTGHSLATTLHAMGEYAQAADRYRDVLQRRQSTLGDNHPDTLRSTQDLAHNLRHIGEYGQARELEEEILQRRRATLGGDHPDTLRIAHELAGTLYVMGEYGQARELEQDILQRRKATLGDNHPHTLLSAHELGVTLYAMGEYAEARDLHQDTLQRRRAILGENHPDTLRTQRHPSLNVRLVGASADDLPRSMSELTIEAYLAGAGGHPDGQTGSAEVQRLDLGSLQIPAVQGVDVRVSVDSNQTVQQVRLVHETSALQISAFAAPVDEGIWDEVRSEIAQQLTESDSPVEEIVGDYGVALHTVIATEDGQNELLFIGVDGPGWMFRGVFQNAGRVPDPTAPLSQCLRKIVVRRGDKVLPVREPLPLRLPPQL